MAKSLTKSTKTDIPALHSNQGLVYTDEEKAEAFADTFEKQFTQNTEQTDDINREQRIEKTAKQITTQTPHEHIQATNAQEIITLIKNTKTIRHPVMIK